MAQTVGGVHEAQLAADAEGIQFHYDLPTAFFRLFLDPTLSYSCHYFLRPDETLAQAAINKLELVARKIELTAEDAVLDVGCGWGSFILWAAERYGCRATGITLSPSQADYVREQAAARGLAERIAVHVMHANAMDLPVGAFDKIVTIGAIKHIAALDGLWRDCARLLRGGPRARLLAHGMTAPAAARGHDPGPRLSGEADFIKEYIPPVGQFTTLGDVVRPLESAGFEVLDVENITDHYTRTLRRWLANLSAHAGDLGAASGVAPEWFRAQLLFLGGCVESFEENRILCYQTLARPIAVDTPRAALPPNRERLILRPDGNEITD